MPVVERSNSLTGERLNRSRAVESLPTLSMPPAPASTVPLTSAPSAEIVTPPFPYNNAGPSTTRLWSTNTVPLVRVPWNDPAHIQKALDAGAYGIICPMINTREEAERLVDSMRYAPLGHRSSGPIRASLYGGADYHAKANDNTAD